MPQPAYEGPAADVMNELSLLRRRVGGVRGCVLTGVDGLLIVHEGAVGPEPNDLAALAAAIHGIGRQTGRTLRQGEHHDSTVHNDRGYFSVYPVTDGVLLAVVGEPGMNVALLHLEARAAAARLAAILASSGGPLFAEHRRL